MTNVPFCQNGKVANLPISAKHGDELCDEYGNRYQYDAGQDAWISKGTISVPSPVTEDSNGIITPDIFDKLLKLEAYTNINKDLRPLKIVPGTGAYWYYFRSSDKCIRFKAEGENQLRVEVDKGRIYQILLKNRCPGVRGPQGDRGDRGATGRSPLAEPCYSPSKISLNKLDFAIFTPTPLYDGGPVELPNNHVPEISVRVVAIQATTSTSTTASKVSDTNQLAYLEATLAPIKNLRPDIYDDFAKTRRIYQEISLGVKPQIKSVCDIELSKVKNGNFDTQLEPLVIIEINPLDPKKITVSYRSDLASDATSLDSTLKSIRFDPATNIVCGSIFLPVGIYWKDQFPAGVCVKSRQKGPDGISGDPGECRIRIVNCDIDSTNIRADCPIINVRLDCEENVIYTLCADLVDTICARYLNFAANAANITNGGGVLKAAFVALEMTLDECKKISRFKIELDDDEIPEIELPHWEPQPGCVKKRHFNRHKFNWIPATAVGTCATQGRWFGPNGVRGSKYPWGIQQSNTPPADECCQEPFFWCPNVQDTPCANGECFVAGTLVSMADGSLKPIELINVGDEVLAIGGTTDIVDAIHELQSQTRMIWRINDKISCTESHAFLTTDGWKSNNPVASGWLYKDKISIKGQLSLQDCLITLNGNESITSLKSSTISCKVYNLTTHNTNTYIVEGYVVHNKETTPTVTTPVQPPVPPPQSGNTTISISQQPLRVYTYIPSTTTPWNSAGEARFSVLASTNGSPITYQWQKIYASGGDWTNIRGATASTLTVSNVRSDVNNGERYRCLLTSDKAVLATSAAILTVGTTPHVIYIDKQLSYKISSQGAVSFTVVASTTSRSPLVYKWEVSTDQGKTYNQISETDTGTLTFATGEKTASNTGEIYRVIIRSSAFDAQQKQSSVRLTIS